MKSSMTETEFREAVKQRACEAGSQAALARHLGVSPQYLGDVISGNRPPGESVLEPLGYERITTYRRRK
jgi:transcriptional regulator with XRE-family HTH domain